MVEIALREGAADEDDDSAPDDRAWSCCGLRRCVLLGYCVRSREESERPVAISVVRRRERGGVKGG
jgi:hypothetical protein